MIRNVNDNINRVFYEGITPYETNKKCAKIAAGDVGYEIACAATRLSYDGFHGFEGVEFANGYRRAMADIVAFIDRYVGENVREQFFFGACDFPWAECFIAEILGRNRK